MNDQKPEAEFTEIVEPSRRLYWPQGLLVCAVAGGLYLVFFHEWGGAITSPPAIAVAGWDELGSCAITVSLDGARELSLLPDGRAILTDNLPMKDGEDIRDRMVEGAWNFDDASKRYTVRLKEESTTYALVSPEHLTICILIKGDIAAADLRESWFSTRDDGDTRDSEISEEHR